MSETTERTPTDAIVYGLSATQRMLHMFVDELTDEQLLHRPTENANCAAWIVGHLVLTDRMALGRLGVDELPALPDGFDKQFSRDKGCPEAKEFGDTSKLMDHFDEHRERLIAATRDATPEQLDTQLDKPHPMFGTVGEIVGFMSVHTAMHCGQITTIRRSLGMPPVV